MMNLLPIHNPVFTMVDPDKRAAYFLCGRKCKNKRRNEELENQRLQAQIEAEQQQAAFDLKLKETARQQAELNNQYLKKISELEASREQQLTEIAIAREQMLLETEKESSLKAAKTKTNIITYSMFIIIAMTALTAIYFLVKK